MRPLLAATAAGTLVTVVSVVWIDRPLARAIARVFPPRTTWANAPDLLGVFVASVSVAALAAWAWAHWRGHARLARLAPLVAVGEPLALGLKYLSKWVFGRTETRMFLSSHGLAGFHHWFDGHGPFRGFPSGHMLVATTLLALACALYPRLRPWSALALVALALALLVTSYHFLGDVVAGWLIGSALAWFILQTDARLRRAAAPRTPT